MPSASWLNGWVTGDVVTAVEFAKGLGSIYDTTLGAPAATVDTGAVIPAGYAHLLIVAYHRSDGATTTLNLRLNNDSGANYNIQQLIGQGAVATAAQAVGQTAAQVGYSPRSTDTANYMGASVILIPHYAGSANFKQIITLNGAVNNAANTVYVSWSVWASAAAINRLTFLEGTGNINTGSRVTVYVMGA